MQLSTTGACCTIFASDLLSLPCQFLEFHVFVIPSLTLLATFFCCIMFSLIFIFSSLILYLWQTNFSHILCDSDCSCYQSCIVWSLIKMQLQTSDMSLCGFWQSWNFENEKVFYKMESIRRKEVCNNKGFATSMIQWTKLLSLGAIQDQPLTVFSSRERETCFHHDFIGCPGCSNIMDDAETLVNVVCKHRNTLWCISVDFVLICKSLNPHFVSPAFFMPYVMLCADDVPYSINFSITWI